MDQAPFGQDSELCKGFRFIREENGTYVTKRTPVAFQQGQTEALRKIHLPGEPRIQLNANIGDSLQEELVTEVLNCLSPHLWLVGTQSSAKISSLTHQIVQGREIVITEKPELHLIWHYNRVFIKPLPKYLLSYSFWDYYLISSLSPIEKPVRNTIKEAALGFLRSYKYLIRHRSDFNLAMKEEHRLLPKGTTYSEFSRFIESLETIDDSMVSARYQYGELRLTRLNFWIKVFLFRSTYHRVEGQYGPYFARFYGPILFLFGVFSVTLSGMQVVLNTTPRTDVSSASWHDITLAFWGFAVFTLIVVLIIICFFLVTFLGLAIRETTFAMKARYIKSRTEQQTQKGVA